MKIDGTQSLHGPLCQHLEVTGHGHLFLFGRLTGNVLVREGGTATIFGAVTGNVLVEEGASVCMYGAIDGVIAGSGSVRTPDRYVGAGFVTERVLCRLPS